MGAQAAAVVPLLHHHPVTALRMQPHNRQRISCIPGAKEVLLLLSSFGTDANACGHRKGTPIGLMPRKCATPDQSWLDMDMETLITLDFCPGWALQVDSILDQRVPSTDGSALGSKSFTFFHLFPVCDWFFSSGAVRSLPTFLMSFPSTACGPGRPVPRP